MCIDLMVMCEKYENYFLQLVSSMETGSLKIRITFLNILGLKFRFSKLGNVWEEMVAMLCFIVQSWVKGSFLVVENPFWELLLGWCWPGRMWRKIKGFKMALESRSLTCRLGAITAMVWETSVSWVLLKIREEKHTLRTKTILCCTGKWMP